MELEVKRGQKVNLQRVSPNSKRILVNIGCEPVKRCRSNNMEIDAFIISIDKNNKVDATVCFYNINAYRGAIKYYGNAPSESSNGKDTWIEINLERIPKNISKLIFFIDIYDAYNRQQHFGKIKNCFVYVEDFYSFKELIHYNVNGNFDSKTGIFVAEIYFLQDNNEWFFKAIGEGVKALDISDMAAMKYNK